MVEKQRIGENFQAFYGGMMSDSPIREKNSMFYGEMTAKSIIFATHKNTYTVKRTIITVMGKDTVGIIARICTLLAERGINILDISQTITGGIFNMIMVVDSTTVDNEFDQFTSDLQGVGTGLGVKITCQKEEIFDMMHRI